MNKDYRFEINVALGDGSEISNIIVFSRDGEHKQKVYKNPTTEHPRGTLVSTCTFDSATENMNALCKLMKKII